MKKILLCLGCFTALLVNAQSPKDLAIPLTVSIDAAKGRATISWPSNANATQYFVFRKMAGDLSFTKISKKLLGTATSFTDTTFQSGKHYEYKVSNTVVSATTYNCIGYASVGDRIVPRHSLGSLLILAVDALKDSLAQEISQLQQDLTMEGWYARVIYVSASDAVTDVKQVIVDQSQELSDLSAVLLLGHVPVPYSGQLNPDGHPNHLGAWPCDGYYGDLDGVWTDNTVNDVSSDYANQHNTPGDGKFDQTLFPSSLELAVGRVDLYDMPAFSSSEITLLRNYLNRNHAYRTQLTKPVFKALVDDNFGSYGEYFAQNAYTSFYGMMDASLVSELDYFSTLDTSNYLWSYGCGGGTFTSAGGVGSTDDFANQNPQGIFSMLFGSYFGDWNVTNNFLRAPLASSNGPLSNCWAGRPWWVFHPMGMGYTLGECGRVSQNNVSAYGNSSTFGYTGVHMGLMGDPSLRMYVLSSPKNLSLNQLTSGQLKLTWDASSDQVDGYYVYWSDSASGPYTLVDTQLIQAVSYIQALPHVGTKYYMVRAAKNQTTAFGSFWNLSPGTDGSVTLTQVPSGIATPSLTSYIVYPNPGTDGFTIDWGNQQLRQGSTLTITDVAGRTMYQSGITGQSMTTYIDTREWASGIYLVSLWNGSNNSVLKWVKP